MHALGIALFFIGAVILWDCVVYYTEKWWSNRGK